jgi:hypothetical protein
VGGWIENVNPKGLPYPHSFVCNEEGKLTDLPTNLIGYLLYNSNYDLTKDLQRGLTGMGFSDYIAGDIVLIKIGDTPEGPDFVSLEDDDIPPLMALLEVLKGICDDIRKQM